MRPAPMGNISLAILWLLFEAALAGNQYCYPEGNTNRFQISRRLEFIEDRIIPQTDGDPVPEEGLSCKWKISNDHLDDPIIVLTGFDTKTYLSKQRWIRSVGFTDQSQLMRYELHSKASNSQRTRVGSGLSASSKEPLNLTQKLRIGMFYEHRTEKVFYLNSAGDKFEMAEFEDANRLNFTVPASNSSVSCGSLRAAQQPGGGEAVGLVDFADCSHPLPALISFADAARNRCENSSATVLTWLREARRSPEQNKEMPDSSNARIIIILVVVASALILMAMCATICLCLFRNRKCCWIRPNGI